MKRLTRAARGGATPRPAAKAFGAFKDNALLELESAVLQRKLEPDPSSYTSKLVGSPKRIRKKLVEEVVELITATRRTGVIWEAADLLYFTVVYLVNRGVGVGEVMGELLRRRAGEKGGKDGQRYAPLRD
ncbi:MAG: phosphoribosyl-ATP diphosphatase [Candidatus ainarchaeum sp.]|nr:phosphoribosyl-ATP diphosphatase [Candidatus ainarchaeum sp.]